MNLGKVFRIFKKGAKASSRGRSKKGEPAGGFEWPSGTRLGLYGHANSGKTVFMTVLNEECKVARDLQISVTDNVTAAEFLGNYRSMWGLGTASGTGTVVDLKGEKKFPEPTESEKLLRFNAVVNRGRKFSVVSFDYDGNAVAISENHPLQDKVHDFMAGCDGILFFFDPKVLGAELQAQAHVASFVNMLEALAPLGARLPIPIGLVITKADILPGFTGDNQTVLIAPEDEHLISEDFEYFLEKVLGSRRVASDAAWAGSVRNILVRLREFLRVVVGRTLDFQIFFVSATGATPEKIGADIGRSIYTPPERMRPVGVREPVRWIMESIARGKGIGKLRKVARVVTVLSLLWILLYSIPFVYHFKALHTEPIELEDRILASHEGNHLATNDSERKLIMRSYRKYEDSWLVRKMYDDFRLPAQRIRETYKEFDLGKAAGRLNGLIGEFVRLIRDSTSWPKVNPKNDSLILSARHQELLDELGRLQGGDGGSILSVRSGRVLDYWAYFTRYLRNRNDTLVSNAIIEQVDYDRENADNFNAAEIELGQALADIARIKKKVVVARADSKEALTAYEDLKERINNSEEPAFLFGRAVRELKSLRGKLDSQGDAGVIKEIRAYLDKVEKWSRRQTFRYRIESIPDMGHLHVEVTGDGGEPQWSNETQMLEGDEFELEWKRGDDIYIAFDELKSQEYWGRQSSDRVILRDEYAVFLMEGEVTFANVDKTVMISFKPELKQMLPRLK